MGCRLDYRRPKQSWREREFWLRQQSRVSNLTILGIMMMAGMIIWLAYVPTFGDVATAQLALLMTNFFVVSLWLIIWCFRSD